MKNTFEFSFNLGFAAKTVDHSESLLSCFFYMFSTYIYKPFDLSANKRQCCKIVKKKKKLKIRLVFLDRFQKNYINP